MTDIPPLAEGFEISTDAARLDRERVHRWLSTDAYWALGRAREKQDEAIAGSLNFGVYDTASGEQVAYARVITDRATFAWLADVFIDPGSQGLGLGKGLVEAIMAHPDLQALRRFMLVTLDAHSLYEQYGFGSPPNPERLMAILRTDLYRQP